MLKARILVTDMPQMLSDIIETAVSLQPDMELVEREDNEGLETVVHRCHVDVAIVGGPISLYQEVWLARRRLKVLVTTGNGRSAEVLEFGHRSLDEPSPQSLLDAIRIALDSDTWRRNH